MKILILTTYYPPDTTIGAVRPYMFAKYLSKLGHAVTVLRSGEILGRCESFFEITPDIRVISCLGEDCPAEAFARGQWQVSEKSKTSRLSFLPEKLRLPVSRLYRYIMTPRKMQQKFQKRMQILEKQKAALAQLKLQGNSFDVVFSTFGELENIYAGQYAAKLFDCKLIQDFRDSAAPSHSLRGFWLKKLQKIQREAVSQADAVTAVSKGLLSELLQNTSDHPIGITLYNGYEPISEFSCQNQALTSEPGILSLCYTGTIYTGKSDFTPILQALKSLNQQGKIDLSQVRLHYAGNSFPELNGLAASLGLEKILVNHGHVGRTEAAQLQQAADLFVVLSWNTKTSQGILTGKFYEGIRCKKPVLSIVSGNTPYSELDLLNQQYHYGFCYETCRKEIQFSKLCDFLYGAYMQKITNGQVEYHPEPSLFADFQYDILAKQLSDLCEKLYHSL